MKSIKQTLLFGFLIWLIPFLVAFAMYSIHETNRPLFESIMPNIIVLSTVVFSVLYFKKLNENYIKEGLLLGIIWLAISILIDLVMFMQGPMKIGFADYIMDIGLTYFIIPTITVGFGYIKSLNE